MERERFNGFNPIQAKSQKRCGNLSQITILRNTLSNYCGKFVKSINIHNLGNAFKIENTHFKSVKALNLMRLINAFRIPLLYSEIVKTLLEEEGNSQAQSLLEDALEF
jgi:hypothetical protein